MLRFTRYYYPSKRADSDPNKIAISDWFKTFEKNLDFTIPTRSNVITTQQWSDFILTSILQWNRGFEFTERYLIIDFKWNINGFKHSLAYKRACCFMCWTWTRVIIHIPNALSSKTAESWPPSRIALASSGYTYDVGQDSPVLLSKTFGIQLVLNKRRGENKRKGQLF